MRPPELARLAAAFSLNVAPGDPAWQDLGGDQAAVLAAARWPSIRDTRAVQAAPVAVLDRCDTWALRVCASMPDRIWAQAAAPGQITPRFLQDWNRRAREIDDRLAAQLQTLIETSLADALRAIGLQVMAAVRDDELRDLLREIPLEDLPAESHRVEVRPGRTLRAAITVEDEQRIRRAVEDLLRKARRLLDRADRDTFEALAEILGVSEVDRDQDRIETALQVLTREFERLIGERARPIEDAPPGQEPIGEQTRGQVPFGIIRAVMLALGGAAVGQGGEPQERQGRALPPGSGTAPAGGGLATGPAAHQALRRELERIGAEARRVALQVADERGRIAAEIARIETQIEQATEARQFRALEAELRRQREATRRALGSLQALRDAAPAGVLDAARLIAGARMRVRGRAVWRRGSPANPFPPHVRLEGRSPEDDDWAQVSVEPFEYRYRAPERAGQTRQVGPFKIDGWFPGDHIGCQCWWDFEATIEIDLADQDPRDPEERVIDEMFDL